MPNTYLISLALGDLLVLIFTVPFVSTIYTIDGWPYGTFECKFSEFVKDVSVGVTVFTLTALSADRYRAIVSPIRKVRVRLCPLPLSFPTLFVCLSHSIFVCMTGQLIQKKWMLLYYNTNYHSFGLYSQPSR